MLEEQSNKIKHIMVSLLNLGNWVGQGRFMAAQTEDGKIIKDNRGKPIPYSAF